MAALAPHLVARNAEIVREREAGTPCPVLAKRFGISPGEVCRVSLRDSAVLRRRHKRKKAGKSKPRSKPVAKGPRKAADPVTAVLGVVRGLDPRIRCAVLLRALQTAKGAWDEHREPAQTHAG